METKNSTYLILTIILVILSAIGGFFLFQFKTASTPVSQVPSTSIPKIELVPTDVIEPEITASPTAKITATPSSTKKITPTATPTAVPTVKITPTTKPTVIPTIKPTLIPTIAPTPISETSSILNLSRPDDGFSVDYSSTRKLYEDTESTGNRYTFYLPSGNFAVHVALNGKWSWTTPDRNFSGDFLVAGLNTYRYDIGSQTIVDLQSNGKNYTIQCVHNGNAALKAECDAFIASFKLL
jgi:hypothetical protein